MANRGGPIAAHAVLGCGKDLVRNYVIGEDLADLTGTDHRFHRVEVARVDGLLEHIQPPAGLVRQAHQRLRLCQRADHRLFHQDVLAGTQGS